MKNKTHKSESISPQALYNYQQRMEQFYMEMAKVMKEKNQSFWLEGYGPLQNQPIEEILFEQGFYVDPNDYEPTHEMLETLTERGYPIIMNFYAPDVILGNLAVKIKDKWFAFGQCKNDIDQKEIYATEIWPLKYVLPRIKYMEIATKFSISIQDSGAFDSMSMLSEVIPRFRLKTKKLHGNIPVTGNV